MSINEKCHYKLNITTVIITTTTNITSSNYNITNTNIKTNTFTNNRNNNSNIATNQSDRLMIFSFFSCRPRYNFPECRPNAQTPGTFAMHSP